MVTVIECVGGWLVAYDPAKGWVSAITYPEGPSACMWMIPGWRGL